MCGRIACALGTDDLSCATANKSKDSNTYKKTKLHKSANNSKPSYNIPPTSSVPILVSAHHKCFEESDETVDRLLVSMRFGLIPPWLQSKDVKSYTHETHLCKIERMRESKLYKPLYEKGYRCAIPCVGYYEWQSTKSTSKQPYFFYNKQNTSSDLIDKTGSFNSESGWTGIQLLYLAGIFSVYTNSEGNKSYSFAIITRETNDEWNWVHHRMPVVLQTNEDVTNWIKQSESSSVFDILSISITNLAAHPVNRVVVNNTKNSSVTCIEPIDINKNTNTLLSSWLASSSKKNVENSVKTENKPNKKRTSLETWLSSAQKKTKKE